MEVKCHALSKKSNVNNKAIEQLMQLLLDITLANQFPSNRALSIQTICLQPSHSPSILSPPVTPSDPTSLSISLLSPTRQITLTSNSHLSFQQNYVITNQKKFNTNRSIDRPVMMKTDSGLPQTEKMFRNKSKATEEGMTG